MEGSPLPGMGILEGTAFIASPAQIQPVALPIVLGHNIDHTAHGILAVKGGEGALHHFDAVNHIKRDKTEGSHADLRIDQRYAIQEDKHLLTAGPA